MNELVSVYCVVPALRFREINQSLRHIAPESSGMSEKLYIKLGILEI